MRKWILPVIIAATAAHASTVTADDCDKLVNAGEVFNITKVDISKKLNEQISQWLKRTTYHEFKTAANLGLEIDIGPIALNANSSQDDWGRFEMWLSQGHEIRINEADAISIFQKTASRDILDAWLACKRNRNGWTLTPKVMKGEKDATIDIVFNSTQGVDAGNASAEISSGGTISGEVPETFTRGETKTILCQRSGSDKDTVIVVHSNRGDATATIPADPPVTKGPATYALRPLLLRCLSTKNPNCGALPQLSLNSRLVYKGPLLPSRALVEGEAMTLVGDDEAKVELQQGDRLAVIRGVYWYRTNNVPPGTGIFYRPPGGDVNYDQDDPRAFGVHTVEISPTGADPDGRTGYKFELTYEINRVK
jgi:hypothetical protein